MYSSYNSKLRSNVVNIFVGEYYITDKSEIISTLLGSCVSVCLMDTSNNVYGMNHFLLPGNIEDKVDISESARFGVHSMEQLITSMEKIGAERKYIQAKMFGGGKIIDVISNAITVNIDNINFTRYFLTSHGIPLMSEDVGGVEGRRIYFNTFDGSVYVEKVKKG